MHSITLILKRDRYAFIKKVYTLLNDYQSCFRYYRILEKSGNVMVINLPPDKNGKLVDDDIKNLMYAADKLNIRRTVNN